MQNCLRLVAIALLSIPMPLVGQSLPSDIPQSFGLTHDNFDYTRQTVEIPMRDGVTLHTVIVMPKGTSNAPILLERTPYNAARSAGDFSGPHILASVRPVSAMFVEAGYILVFQDVRGKYGSKGAYVDVRPLRGPNNDSQIDESTDAWDTIDWLIKHLPESNARVGMIGTSYPGWLVAMGLVNPHPALKAAVPANPMIDIWMGDDDFHNGAARLISYDYVASAEGARAESEKPWREAYDDYDVFLRTVSGNGFAKSRGLDQLPMVRRLQDHPAFDSFWKGEALQYVLANQPQTVPTLWVAGQWDQEDTFGAIAAFLAVKGHDPTAVNHLVIGPWNHGGWGRDGSSLGPIRFDADTGLWFRQSILLPFLNAQLKPGAPAADIPAVMAFQTGTNRWQRLDDWPRSYAANCSAKSRPIYLQADGVLGFTAPTARGPASDSYVSDPAKPIPYRIRPILPIGAPGSTWGQWLVDDQRPFSDRTDVLTYVTPPLTEAVAIAGEPIANLVASTTGTDGDFVVKLIDVYPDQYPAKREMGGYQLGVSMNIFRGRYREGYETAKPIAARKPLVFRFALPHANHVFLQGHRIMVQVQSSWFPLYDRNPQSFVPNIFYAKPADYRKATITIYHSAANSSFVELPVVWPSS